MVYETEQNGMIAVITRNGKKVMEVSVFEGGPNMAEKVTMALNEAHGLAIANLIVGLPEKQRIKLLDSMIKAAGIDPDALSEAVGTPAQT